MIVSARALTKQFGRVRAVDDLTFELPAGRVTGFLGPNGAGKTTTLRMLLGLVEPTAGEAPIGDRRYVDLPKPRRAVGAVLEATGYHPGRRARDHLRILAGLAGASRDRVDHVFDQVGLLDVADRRVGGYSLGMRQRLGLAAALLGDPEVLILDEPANGLDPEGIAWLRSLLRSLAGEGRTILVSSHVLSEVAQTVDHVVIISRGQLRFAGPLRALERGAVTVRTPRPEQLRANLVSRGYEATTSDASTLVVHGATAAQVGHVAATERIELHALTDSGASLEEAFLSLTSADDRSAPAAITAEGLRA